MNLLFKKQRQGHSNHSNLIRISKGTISVNGTSADRLLDKQKTNYLGIGINIEGNLCLYLTTSANSGLFKLYKDKMKNNYRITFCTKEAMQAVEPYKGEYEIKYVSLENKEYKEIILKKM